MKDHNNRSGVHRNTWKWFDMMDAIYGHRPVSRGREGGIDTATSLLDSMLEPIGKICYSSYRELCALFVILFSDLNNC